MHDYRNVTVSCYWDNEELHDDSRKPLYRIWSESLAPSALLRALAAEEKNISKTNMRQILNAVQINDLAPAVRILLNERQKVFAQTGTVKNAGFHSLYRDILFFAFVAIGRDNIDHGKQTIWNNIRRGN